MSGLFLRSHSLFTLRPRFQRSPASIWWLWFEVSKSPQPQFDPVRAALQEAVDTYGKPGGPWNVPNDPGGWLDRARKALAAKATGGAS